MTDWREEIGRTIRQLTAALQEADRDLDYKDGKILGRDQTIANLKRTLADYRVIVAEKDERIATLEQRLLLSEVPPAPEPRVPRFENGCYVIEGGVQIPVTGASASVGLTNDLPTNEELKVSFVGATNWSKPIDLPLGMTVVDAENKPLLVDGVPAGVWTVSSADPPSHVDIEFGPAPGDQSWEWNVPAAPPPKPWKMFRAVYPEGKPAEAVLTGVSTIWTGLIMRLPNGSHAYYYEEGKAAIISRRVPTWALERIVEDRRNPKEGRF